MNIQVISVFIFFFGCVSFRSVPRILHTISGYIGLTTPIMHFSSVINWCLKVGLHRLVNVVPLSTPWTAIIDASIEWGKKKALVVLRVPSEIMKDCKGALTLNDVEVVSLTIHEKLDGEGVKDVLQGVFDQLGPPLQVLSDGGAELAKGIRLLQSANNDDLVHSLDIGHYFANRLKRLYAEQEDFKNLVSFATQVGNKLRQTVMAWIVPNKLRNKGRFQSISRLAKWARQVFDYCQAYKNDHDKVSQQLFEEHFSDDDGLVSFATTFHEDCQVMNQLQKQIKQKGLSDSTYKTCLEIVASSSISTSLRSEIEAYLSDHLNRLKNQSIQVGLMSTDIIECLFGKFKYIKERSSLKDFNKLSLLIPLFAGNLNEDEVIRALSDTTMTDLKVWEDKHIGDTYLKERRRYFSKLKAENRVPEDAEAKLSKAA